MGLSTWGRNHLLDLALGQGQSPEATWYVALLTAEPSVGSTGSTIVEPVGGAYARVAVTNNGTNFGPAAGGSIDLLTVAQFPTATATWGTILFGALVDASAAGNLLGWGPLAVPRTVLTGQSPKVPAGTTLVTF